MKTRKSISWSALFIALALFSCNDDDDDTTNPAETPNLVEVVSYNSPQNLNENRSNPERASLDSPEEFYEFTFTVPEGANSAKMSFVSMSSISNDWLFAPRGSGINIFNNDGAAITGDITNQILLWDAGTEEENEATRGGGSPELRADDDNANVRVVEADVSEYLKAEITNYNASNRTFTLRIENLRGEFADPDPIRISPGVLVVHNDNNPFFTEGAADRGDGLQLLAERGNFSELLESLNAELNK